MDLTGLLRLLAPTSPVGGLKIPGTGGGMYDTGTGKWEGGPEMHGPPFNIDSRKVTDDGLAESLKGMFGSIAGTANQAANAYPKTLRNRREQLITEAFKLLGEPPKTPKRKKPINKEDLLTLLVGGLGAGALGASSDDVSEGFKGFLGARSAMADQDYDEQVMAAREQDRIRGVQSQEKLALAGLAGEEEQRYNELQRLIQQEMERKARDAQDQANKDRDYDLRVKAFEAKTPPEVVKALGTLTDSKADPIAIGAALDIIEQHRVSQGLPPFTPEQRAAYMQPRYVQKNVEGDNARDDRKLAQKDRELDQKMKRNEAYFKANEATIKAKLAGIGLTEARTQDVLSRISFRDREFQLKAANTYSLIADREQRGGGVAKVSDYEKLIKLNERQIAKWQAEEAALTAIGMRGPNAEKIAELQKENAALTEQMRKAAESRVGINFTPDEKAGNKPVTLSGSINGGKFVIREKKK